MGQKDKQAGGFELSRRDFLKVGAAGAAAAGALGFAPAPAMAEMPLHTLAGGFSANDTTINRFHTTCPYCSASCGQIVAVGDKTGDVYDIYGDVDSPINNGGLCAKGAGAFQLVNNKRRLGAFAGTHPVNPVFEAKPSGTTFSAVPTGWTGSAYTPSSYTYGGGVAYWRLANGAWNPVPLDVAMDDIAAKLVSDRGTITPGTTLASNAKTVQFFGSSHLNNEQNYTYRKLIAQFGTSLVEHQARI
jgi:anaerobic selenocysteine-containing dehydrogenase